MYTHTPSSISIPQCQWTSSSLPCPNLHIPQVLYPFLNVSGHLAHFPVLTTLQNAGIDIGVQHVLHLWFVEGTGASHVVLLAKNPPANAGGARDVSLVLKHCVLCTVRALLTSPTPYPAQRLCLFSDILAPGSSSQQRLMEPAIHTNPAGSIVGAAVFLGRKFPEICLVLQLFMSLEHVTWTQT